MKSYKATCFLLGCLFVFAGCNSDKTKSGAAKSDSAKLTDAAKSDTAKSDKIKKAEEYVIIGTYKKAMDLLEQEIKDNPANARAFFLMGRCSIAMNDRVAAQMCFERAITLDPQMKELVGLANQASENNEIEKSRLMALKTDLSRIRTLLQFYRITHNNVYPKTWEQMQKCTDAAGNIVENAGSTPVYGPYLEELPTNQFNSLSTLKIGSGPNPKDNSSGWYYNSTTGVFQANCANIVGDVTVGNL